MPEITVTDYDGLEIDAESRAVTVTLVDGQPARGLPAGGTTNQVLAKASDADYDVAWVDDGVGGGGSLVTVDADGTVTVDGSGVELATDAQLAAHEADTTGVHGITDTSALVVTTDPRLSDARTPTAHTHDDRYYTETEVDTALSGKAATSHSHATSDVTGLDAALADKAAATDLIAHTGNTSNPHGVTKAQVGLANVDDTSDASKPISTATQAALDAKANAADLTAHLNDTADAHDASAISFAPTGTIAATDVQAAIAEVAAEAGGGGLTQEQVEDIIGTKVVAGTNVTVNYDDTAGTTTISATGGSGGGGFTGATILRKSTGTTVNNAWTAIPWDIEDLDTLGLHSTVTNTSRLTASEAMVLYVNVALLMTGSAVTKYVSIRKNGSAAAMPTHTYLTLLSDGLYYLPLSGHISLAAGDYIEVWAYANSSSTAASSANGGEMHSRFSCHRVA